MLGASILSFFEVIDLVLFLIYNLLLTPLHKKNKEEKKYDSVPVGETMEYEEGQNEGEEDELNGDVERMCSEDDSAVLEDSKMIASVDSLHPPLMIRSWKSGNECNSEGDRVTTL